MTTYEIKQKQDSNAVLVPVVNTTTGNSNGVDLTALGYNDNFVKIDKAQLEALIKQIIK